MEAIACGTPVIASNAYSLPEVVGEAGILIDPHDVGGLIEAMERVLLDEPLRSEMRARGLEWARGFTWEKAVWETLAVYREVVQMLLPCHAL